MFVKIYNLRTMELTNQLIRVHFTKIKFKKNRLRHRQIVV